MFTHALGQCNLITHFAKYTHILTSKTDTMQQVNQTIADKISKLLSKAKSTDSQNEADALIAKAMQLMNDHNITNRDIEQHEADITEKSEAKLTGWKYRLKVFLYQINNCAITQKGKVATYYGAKNDLQVAEFMYQYYTNCVAQFAEKYWLQYGGHSKLSVKGDYCKGALVGLKHKLFRESKLAIEACSDLQSVIHIKKAAVSEYLDVKYGKLKTRTSSKLSYNNGHAMQQGHSDAHGIKTGAKQLM
jgi:hypothetical protein